MSEPNWELLGGGGVIGGPVDYVGAWAAGTTYQPGQVVRYNGVDYIAVNPSIGQTPPAQVSDTGWLTPTLLNGWTNYLAGHPPVGYRKLANGLVLLQGLLAGTGTAQICFVLPAGFRPLYILHMPTIQVSAIGYSHVRPNGEVTVNPYTPVPGWYSFNGITFMAEQ